MLAGVLDGGKGADDALVVGYFGAVERNVKVDLGEGCLASRFYTLGRCE